MWPQVSVKEDLVPSVNASKVLAADSPLRSVMIRDAVAVLVKTMDFRADTRTILAESNYLLGIFTHLSDLVRD